MMTLAPNAATAPTPLIRQFWLWAAAITLFRVATLIFAQIDLGPDESQYWYWAQSPDFGYFSKPPMIAWAIAATTALFGDAEWAVRLPAPLFHLGAAFFLYAAARRLASEPVAFWTGLAWLTMPGVLLSSLLITTDAPLLFFWSAALYATVRILGADDSRIGDFLLLGGAVGGGLLSKYAMLYFPVGLAAALAIDSGLRRKLLRPALAAAGLLALALFAPNIIWNAAHDFSTVAHTAANANWGADLFKPGKLAAFLIEQFAIAGVVPAAALIAAVAMRRRASAAICSRAAYVLLISVALAPLAIVSVQAFISRAHANWAAAAYPAAIVLTTWLLFALGKGWLAKASIAVHAAAMLVLSVGVANLSLVDAVGLTDATAEVRGWQAQSALVDEMGRGYDAIVIDDRPLIGAMLFYRSGSPNEVAAIDPNASVDNHYEAFKAFDPKRHKRVLFITTRNDAAHVDYRFRNITPLGPVSTPIGDRETRTYHAFEISDYFGPETP